MARKLTAKQNKFIDGILDGMTQADAYRSAYNTSKMTPEIIATKACNLAKQDNIRVILDQRKKELENAAIWERKHALETLKKIADADIKDFLTFKTAKTIVGHDDKTGEPIVDYSHIVDLMDSCDVDGKLIQEISISKDGTLKFKLYDKLKAAEMANKMCGYNEPEKIQIGGTEDAECKLELMLRLAGYEKNK